MATKGTSTSVGDKSSSGASGGLSAISGQYGGTTTKPATTKTTTKTTTTPKVTTTPTVKPSTPTTKPPASNIKPVDPSQFNNRPIVQPVQPVDPYQPGGGGADVNQPTQYDQFDPTDYINQLKQAQMQSRISALDKARSTALSALDAEKSNVAPVYYDKRNQAAAASDVGAMNFANYMASRGIKGAAGAMPEIYRNVGLQGQIGALDRQEASALGAVESQRANVESGYASDVAAANADAEAQAMQSAIDQYNTNRTYALQQAASNLDQSKFNYSKSSSNPEYQASIAAAKKAALEATAMEIENSYLPETLKLQAKQLKQKVDAGGLDAATAQAQLNQIKAQTANYLRDANEPYKTSSSANSSSSKINPQNTQAVIAELSQHNATGKANLFKQYASYWASQGVDISKVKTTFDL